MMRLMNDDDNRSSFFLPKHTPFIARQEEIFVETEERIAYYSIIAD